jgi:hypothetical protein
MSVSMRLTGVALGAVALLVVGVVPAAADRCTGAKLKALGKKEAGLLGCQSKVAMTNDTSGLSACETKVKGKFSTAFGKAGTCAGDEMICEDDADGCEATVSTAMTDTFPSPCEAAKRRAAGKLAKGELGCYAKAAAKGVAVDTVGCIPKATGKFSAALTKAGACPDGGSPQMLVEDNCVTPAVTTDGGGMVTDVCPTTTTTSTTTSTTSTSTTNSTTTTSTTTTSTTSTTFPSCSTAGATCGTCGSGMCFPLCGHGCTLGCIDTSAGSGGTCGSDAQCNAGELCAANNPPSGQCGDCGGLGTACQLPCP